MDNPIWKSSYRLALEGKDGKPHLQGWAVVQNTTEEDWKDVRIVLVSGRPISFTMDLAQTLFMPRPPVTPEVYASLQPPTHAPAMPGMGGFQGGFGGGLSGGLQGGIRIGGRDMEKSEDGEGRSRNVPNPFALINRYQMDIVPRAAGPARLSYEELMQRRNTSVAARAVAAKLANDPALESIAVDAGTIGEGFRLLVDQPVSLPRQRSALLPVQHGPIALTPISLYNRATHPRFPLQGAKIKNTTGQHLLSGPATVTDAEGYVGDCKLPNLQPNEGRYISFAMDLGLEITPETAAPTTEYGPVRIRKGELVRPYTTTTKTTYRLNNRSPKGRTLLLDHIPQPGSLVIGKNKPFESAKGLHRFEWSIEPKRVVEEAVTEQKTGDESRYLSRLNASSLKWYADLDSTSKPVREALLEIIRFTGRIEAASTEAEKPSARSKGILAEQSRILTNSYLLPAGHPTTKRLLENFAKLEDELQKVREDAKDKAATLAALQKEFDAFVDKLDLK